MKKVSFIAFFFISLLACAQKNVTTVGIQIKPLVPSGLFDTENVLAFEGQTSINIQQRIGTAFGMVIRKGLTNRFSFETGMNYVKRSYSLNVSVPDSSIDVNGRFSYIGYEIPISTLLYIRLGKNTYMNNALGFNLDLYPSNIETVEDNYVQLSVRPNWAKIALLANLGFEYRTKKDGYFYLGTSYHRNFSDITQTKITSYSSENNLIIDEVMTGLSGNYLTIDFRYFFHEDPERKTSRR